MTRTEEDTLKALIREFAAISLGISDLREEITELKNVVAQSLLVDES